MATLVIDKAKEDLVVKVSEKVAVIVDGVGHEPSEQFIVGRSSEVVSTPVPCETVPEKFDC